MWRLLIWFYETIIDRFDFHHAFIFSYPKDWTTGTRFFIGRPGWQIAFSRILRREKISGLLFP